MNRLKYCHSCSMPMDKAELQGTEMNGAKSDLYCKYCYQNGAFTRPEMTLKEMTSRVVTQMKKMNLHSRSIDLAIGSLPNLKRWKNRKNAAEYSNL